MISDSNYTLLDGGNFQKLEQIGPFRFVRPSPGAVWSPRLGNKDWNRFDAKFNRFSGGDGKWDIANKKVKEEWEILHGGVKLLCQITDFGHVGFFAEQGTNWKKLTQLCNADNFHVLNLFAYTGGASLAAAKGGAHVVHLDASKTSVGWARRNAEINGLSEHPIRWIVDDALKFTAREVKRGRKYQGIVLDPPSYGRGTKGEVWKIEDSMIPLLDNLKCLMADDLKFIHLSSHSSGYSPQALKNLLVDILGSRQGAFEFDEMLVTESNGIRNLPAGSSCFYIRN